MQQKIQENAAENPGKCSRESRKIQQKPRKMQQKIQENTPENTGKCTKNTGKCTRKYRKMYQKIESIITAMNLHISMMQVVFFFVFLIFFYEFILLLLLFCNVLVGGRAKPNDIMATTEATIKDTKHEGLNSKYIFEKSRTKKAETLQKARKETVKISVTNGRRVNIYSNGLVTVNLSC